MKSRLYTGATMLLAAAALSLGACSYHHTTVEPTASAPATVIAPAPAQPNTIVVPQSQPNTVVVEPPPA